MASPAAALAIADQKSRSDALLALAAAYRDSRNVAGLKEISDAALHESNSIAATRTVLKAVAEAADALPDYDETVAVAEYAVEKLRPRVSQLEDADYALRFVLFRTYGGAEDFLRAAGVLAGARLDSSLISDADRARALVRCAQYYIRADDDVAAESFIRRASDVVFRLGDRALLIQFKAAHAQVLDAKRKFIEAALRYLDVMRSVEAAEVDEAELIAFVEKAAICAVLAPAGPQRQRVMGTLMRLDKIALVQPSVYGLLERMFHDKFLSPADVAAFESRLLPHQKATDATGTTVMQRAMVEHNMLAASKVYKNIRVSALAAVLGVDEHRAERVAATMIKERRLAASIDQVDGFVDFAPTQPSAGSGAMKVSAGASAASDVERVVGTSYPAAAASSSTTAEGAASRLLAWDAAIKDVCLKVNAAVEAVGAQCPELLPK